MAKFCLSLVHEVSGEEINITEEGVDAEDMINNISAKYPEHIVVRVKPLDGEDNDE